ncbi:uncharacterized protein LOC117925481 [Vitis riparia]|uniref:uncharacterized protein LOC117925481 n=1 Tax=Vitis riparia TaxID=96939 RepID=UPI0001984505|nr:uncharacterized protein LOC117925481 [Vitis riparia]|eukprot:XP_002263199.1 PREDICTED: uncharacterized protein LOC100254783 [Vitis vinifera]
MSLVFVGNSEEKELGRQKAPGMCPYCEGKVTAMDVESQFRCCFLPVCYKIKRKYVCTSCSKQLVLYSE